MPSHLGPKSPRVTNANHEIDKYAQVLKGGLLSILNLTQPTRWILQFGSLTKRGLESVLKAQKHVWKSVESAVSKGGG